jgi:hypothetical protein
MLTLDFRTDKLETVICVLYIPYLCWEADILYTLNISQVPVNIHHQNHSTISKQHREVIVALYCTIYVTYLYITTRNTYRFDTTETVP